MRPFQLAALSAALGVVVGAGVGYVVFSAAPDPDDGADPDETVALRAEVARLESRLADTRRRDGARPRVDPAEVASDPAAGADVAPAPAAPAAAASPDEGERRSPEERAARVAELSAQLPVWLDRGDGEAALAALRELAALVPEGREAAMALALDINRDVRGAGRLGLSDVLFYTGLGDPSVVALMDWALTEDSTPSDFRVMAAYSVPWTQSPAETLEQLGAALATERSVDVQRALLANLGRLKGAEAERLLGDVLGDADRDAGLRAMVAMQLATTQDAGVLRTLETTAESDEDAAVRAAARAALVVRDPPATGYLVTGTVPSSQAEAAGLRAGDILVRYDGKETPTIEDLRAAASAAEGAPAVRVVVVRDGQEVEVEMRPGRLGVFGQAVEAGAK